MDDRKREQKMDSVTDVAENTCEWIADIYRNEARFLGIIERNLGECQDKEACSSEVFWTTLKNVSAKDKSEVDTADGYFVRSAKRYAWRYPTNCVYCKHTSTDDENILEAIYHKMQAGLPQTEWRLNFAILLKEFRDSVKREDWIFFDLAFCQGLNDDELMRALRENFEIDLKPAAVRQRRRRIRLKFIEFYESKESGRERFQQVARKVLINN